MRTIKFFLLSGFLGFLWACESGPTSQSVTARADSLAHAVIITDGHIDLPYRLKGQGQITSDAIQSVILKSEIGDFDYERARKGGLDAPFMSIYIPSDFNEDASGAMALTDTLIGMVDAIVTSNPDKFAHARSPQEVESNFARGLISLPMGIENGAPVGAQLENVQLWRDRGVSYITLTHSKDNKICDSSYDTTRTWNGLSPFGKEVVREMNRVGIMVDVSHISDSAFWQVMEISEVPVIASHSSCRHFTPGWERNMNDEMIQALANQGGVIQINFGSSFIDSTSRAYFSKAWPELRSWRREHHVDMHDPAFAEFLREYRKENGDGLSTVERVVDHIDHVVAIAGIDHVGLGSDFDGLGPSLPKGLGDVSMYPNLIAVLLERGYTEAEIEKICYKNVFRVWSSVLQYAHDHNQKLTTQ